MAAPEFRYRTGGRVSLPAEEEVRAFPVPRTSTPSSLTLRGVAWERGGWWRSGLEMVKPPNQSCLCGSPWVRPKAVQQSWGRSAYVDLALEKEIPGGIQELPKVRNLPQSRAGETTDCRTMPRFLLLKRSKFHAGREKKLGEMTGWENPGPEQLLSTTFPWYKLPSSSFSV